jgi:hypothetical protein
MLRALPALLAVLIAAPASAAIDPEQVVETARRLDTRSLDTKRTFPADGQVLQRDGLLATFESGAFHPIVRDDGKVIGLVFEGKGTLELMVPRGPETVGWQNLTDYSSMLQEFTGAYLRYTDGTGFELQGDHEWAPGGDADGSAFRLFEARTKRLEDPLWTKWNVNLVIDQLRDLYGGGHAGGHVFAEFRAEGGNWLSYLHNPRGALMPGETTTVWTSRPSAMGWAAPDLALLTSFGKNPETLPLYDVANIEIDATFPTPRGTADLVRVEAKATLDLVNVQPRPLKAVVLELESQRLLCNAQVEDTKIRVTGARDAEGNVLAAIHRGDRLFVPLNKPVAYGEATSITLEWEGPVTQGLVAQQPDVYFSEIGPWAWYPRNPLPDRHGSTVRLHLPRFMRGVTTGDLVEEREEKDGWHFTYTEPSGVKNLTLVVGDLIKAKDKEQGSNPRIITWFGSTENDQMPNSAKNTRAMLDGIVGIWGPYPYSTLHVVETISFPAGNWGVGQDGQAGRWACVPPEQVHPWQGFVDGPSGMILTAFPTTAPSRDMNEGRGYDRLLVDQLEPSRYLRIAALTRQWWGHLVPAKTYRDVWINEAFAHWTAMLFIQTGVGRDALKQRLNAMRVLLNEHHDVSPPLAHGERLGRSFHAQAWTRGPLLISWMVDRLGSKPFANAMDSLLRRAAGPGVETALLYDVVEEVGGEAMLNQLRTAVETNTLPELEYNLSLDKKTGQATVVVRHAGEPVPVDLRIEAVWGPKQRQFRVASMEADDLVFRWEFDSPPKRLLVDPVKSALALSVKKNASIEIPAWPEAGDGASE